VWGRWATLDSVLRDGDRVEIYRPLQADPKEVRRRRAAKKRGVR
jgi:putative ubiquitin-RnfH superfamily antitoxin RatB of RatAB toxin-antitoxin module